MDCNCSSISYLQRRCIQPAVEVGHGWVITSREDYECNYLSMHLSQLICFSKRGPWHHYANHVDQLLSFNLIGLKGRFSERTFFGNGEGCLVLFIYRIECFRWIRYIWTNKLALSIPYWLPNVFKLHTHEGWIFKCLICYDNSISEGQIDIFDGMHFTGTKAPFWHPESFIDKLVTCPLLGPDMHERRVTIIKDLICAPNRESWYIISLSYLGLCHLNRIY